MKTTVQWIMLAGFWGSFLVILWGACGVFSPVNKFTGEYDDLLSIGVRIACLLIILGICLTKLFEIPHFLQLLPI